jgi:hypothetical protein
VWLVYRQATEIIIIVSVIIVVPSSLIKISANTFTIVTFAAIGSRVRYDVLLLDINWNTESEVVVVSVTEREHTSTSLNLLSSPSASKLVAGLTKKKGVDFYDWKVVGPCVVKEV